MLFTTGLYSFIATCFLVLTITGQQPDILIADFEEATYGTWWAEGTAFGTGPAKGALPGQMKVSGFEGQGLVNSFNGGDRAIGMLTSPLFTIERKYLTFLIGGGGWAGKSCMNLVVDGETLRTATGPNLKPGGSEDLEPASWDVSELVGKTARIQIVDLATGGWGHINVDHIKATDTLPPQPRTNAERQLTADKRWLMLPIKNGGKKCRMEVRDGTAVLRSFDIELAEGEPDWWAPLDLGVWHGKSLTLWADKLPGNSKGLENAKLSDEAFPQQGRYQEALRPQLHFSPALGWNNDPNGLVFFNNEYHLFFQHNPYGVGWGNMHWGHAVSKDLVHWQEIGEALYPDALGTMYSGSAVVDHANTSGFGKDGKIPLVLIYTAAGNPSTQCIAHSLDGRTFTKYEGNPVVANITGGNRDPKVFWHAPTKRWIMALYVGRPEKLHTIELLASTNLREWAPLSAVPGDKGGGNYLYECPDLFELSCKTGADTTQKKWVLFGANGEYAIGDFDGTDFKPEAERLKGHCGTIPYAGQTFSDLPDGRRVLINWLRAPSPGMSFNQCMSLPQELGLKKIADGIRLTYAPVKELAALRERTQRFGPIDLAADDKDPLAGFEAELVELRVACNPSPDALLSFNLRGVPIRYDAEKQSLTIAGHTTAWPLKDGQLALIIYLDRTCIELFSQDALLYAPVAAIPDAAQRSVSLKVEKGAAKGVSGTVHALKFIW